MTTIGGSTTAAASRPGPGGLGALLALALWLACTTGAMACAGYGSARADAAAASRADADAAADSDGDGVPDARDRCRGRLPGASEHDAAGCPAAFDPYAGLDYDDAKHAAWYRRFWTGRCEGLGFFSDGCIEDKGGWPVQIERTVARLPAPDRPPARAEMWGLGRLIGHEWARDNDLRSIHTDDLKRWRGVLDDATDAWRGLADVCARARSRLDGGGTR